MVRFKPTWSGMVVAALLASLAVVIGSVVVTEKPASRMLPRVFRAVSAQEDISENQSTDRVLPLPLVEAENLIPPPAELLGVDLTNQSAKQAALKSHGCMTCHVGVGDMHRSPNVVLGCRKSVV